jgi:hypothetical protein
MNMDHYFVKSYGYNKVFNPLQPGEKEVLVDEALVNKYPELLPSNK